MQPLPVQGLADLHLRYDGPITHTLRDAALADGSDIPGRSCPGLNRDINSLALASVRSLARLRQSASAKHDLCHFHNDSRVMRLASALQTYRSVGSRLAAEDSGATAVRMSATDSFSP